MRDLTYNRYIDLNSSTNTKTVVNIVAIDIVVDHSFLPTRMKRLFCFINL